MLLTKTNVHFFLQDTWDHSALFKSVMVACMDVVTEANMANHAPVILVGLTKTDFLALIPLTGPARSSGTVWSRASMVAVQTTLTSVNVLHLTLVLIAILYSVHSAARPRRATAATPTKSSAATTGITIAVW